MPGLTARLQVLLASLPISPYREVQIGFVASFLSDIKRAKFGMGLVTLRTPASLER